MSSMALRIMKSSAPPAKASGRKSAPPLGGVSWSVGDSRGDVDVKVAGVPAAEEAYD